MRKVAESAQECLGLAVRAWRKSEGLTGVEAALRMGCGQSDISRLESGKRELRLLDVERAGMDPLALLAFAKDIAEQAGVAWPGPRPNRGSGWWKAQ